MREHRLRTPEDKVRRLQQRLSLSAKLDKQRRFHQRLRKWLMRRRQRRGMGYSQYPAARLYEALGLYRLADPAARRRGA
ncbi:hypothetical protein LLG95_09625 [bacterium]|nr:hypothetical protein [bacterium]